VAVLESAPVLDPVADGAPPQERAEPEPEQEPEAEADAADDEGKAADAWGYTPMSEWGMDER
jgi:hypothetical protein